MIEGHAHSHPPHTPCFEIIFHTPYTVQNMSTTKKKRLPKWAHLVSPRFLKRNTKRKEPLDLEEEEVYLRTRSFHKLSRLIDGAVHDSLESLAVQPFQEKLNHLLKETTFEENEEESDPPAKRPRTETNGDDGQGNQLEAMFTVEPSSSSCPSLLPILLLHGPACEMDRQRMLHSLISANRRQKPRTCTVWLKNNPSPEEVTRQCLSQETDLPPAFQTKSFFDTASLTETLLEWARYTASFDHITVFLHMETDFNSTTVQDFVHWMALGRARHRLPLSFVLCTPHTGRRPLKLQSSSQGPIGLLVRHYTLPSTASLLDAFWEQLWLKRLFPLFASTAVWNRLGFIFREQNASAVYLASQFKLWLAHQLCDTGSFFLAARTLSLNEQRRVLWFLTDTEAKDLVGSSRFVSSYPIHDSIKGWAEELERKRLRLCLGLQIMHTLRKLRGSTGPFLFLSGKTPSGFDVNVDDKDRKKIFALLLKLRQQDAPSSKVYFCSDRPHYKRELVHLTNQIIVLLDKCGTYSEMDRCLVNLQEEWFHHAAGNETSSVAAALDVQPRRHAMRGLLEGLPVTDAPSNLVTLVGNMLNLVQDRAAVYQTEWFDMFRQTFALERTRQEALLLFGYGIYHLKLCGLLRGRWIAIKKDTRYEKVMLVWCSD